MKNLARATKKPYHAQKCLRYELLDVGETLRSCVSACWSCASPFLWASASALWEHRVPREHREDISLQEMGCCLNLCRRHASLLPILDEDAPIFVVFFTDLNRKSNAVGQKSSSNKTSRYAPDSLLFLTEHLQMENMLFPKDTPSEALS